jgi:hypothetical protein
LVSEGTAALCSTSAGYYALAIAIIWPATAFLVAVLILSPTRDWSPHLLAVIPAHFHMVYHFQNADLPSIVILTQLTGNLSLAVITALVVRTTSETPLRLESFQSLLRFILVAGLAVPGVVNALILCLHLGTG